MHEINDSSSSLGLEEQDQAVTFEDKIMLYDVL